MGALHGVKLEELEVLGIEGVERVLLLGLCEERGHLKDHNSYCQGLP